MPSTGMPPLFLLVLAPLVLPGCPPAPPSLDLPPPEAASDEPPTPTAEEEAAQEEANNSPGVPIDPERLSFKVYIEPGAPTVTVHGVVHGISEGQVDFTAFEGGIRDKGPPEAIHVQRFQNGTFEVEAPANFARPLFVSALTLDEEGRPNALVPQATLPDPLIIGDKDVSITLEMEPESSAPATTEASPAAPAEKAPAPGTAPATGAAPAAGAAPATE
jgi:hypothetical protein